jgi:hypothetical protein
VPGREAARSTDAARPLGPGAEIPPELANSYWAQVVNTPVTSTEPYEGGREAPKPGQGFVDHIYRYGGAQVTEKDGEKLAKLGWTYGMPAPKGFRYNKQGLLENPTSWNELAMQGGLILGTAATGGALSPVAAAAVGGGLATGAAKLGGASWKQALIAGGLGAASAGLGASSLGSGAKIAGQAGIGAAQGAAAGGGIRGALLGAAQSGGAAATSAATPKGGGTVPATTTPAASQSLTNYLIQAGLGAAAGAGGGMTGIVMGAGAGAAGAAGGQTNTQAAIQAGSSLASKILSGAQAAASAAGNAAAAREAGRQTQAGQMVDQDQQRLTAGIAKENAVQGRAGVEIDQRTEGRASQNDAYKNALLSALALNTRDVSANRPAGVPTISFSGGARPSAIGPEGRAAAQLMNRRSLDTLTNPAALTALPEMASFTPSALPKASGADTALGIAGAAGNFLTGMQQNQAANERSTLINALIQQAQQQASQGLDQPAVAPRPRTVQDEVDAVNQRLAGVGR